MHALKLDIERRMKAVADNFEKYEQARIMIRVDYNKVALEGDCWGDCDRLIYVGIELRDYRESVVIHTPNGLVFSQEHVRNVIQIHSLSL